MEKGPSARNGSLARVETIKEKPSTKDKEEFIEALDPLVVEEKKVHGMSNKPEVTTSVFGKQLIYVVMRPTIMRV